MNYSNEHSRIESWNKRYGNAMSLKENRDVGRNVPDNRIDVDSKQVKSFADLDKVIQEDSTRRHFAFVNWFNSEKGFGTVIAPKLSVSLGNRPESGNFVELFLHITEMESQIAPSEEAWVLFKQETIRKKS